MPLPNLCYICGLSFILVTHAFAQKETPPEGGEPKDFVLPPKETVTLSNGLIATLVPYGTIPKVSVRIAVQVGNIDESENEIWLADLTGDLMKEGTTSRAGEKIAQEAAGMGGGVNVSVGPDLTNISGDVLSEYGSRLVELLADIVRNPIFPESELERLKKDRVRDLGIRKTRPRSIALEKFREVIYPEHPYGRLLPTEQMIQSYGIEKIRGFYGDNFGAVRTHVYVAGHFNSNEMKSAIRGAFGDWTRGPDPLINIPSPVSKRAIYLIDRPDAKQSTVYIGLPVIDPANDDYLALLVTNTLLGGAFASRITSNIREEKGYTYSPFSQISTRYRDAYWLEVADVTTDVTGPSLREIFYEINRLQDEPPSAEELKGIQNYLAGRFVLQNSSRSGIIGQLSFLALHGLNDDYLTEYVRNVHSITAEDIRTMAKTYLRDEEMTIVIAGDRNKIYDQVSKYGDVIE